MSDTAIPSQIATEVNASQARGTATTVPEKGAAAKTQVSEFDKVLEEKLESPKTQTEQDVLQQQSLVDINSLLNANPLLSSPANPLTANSGKFLPAQLSPEQQSLDDILLASANPNLAKNLLADGTLKQPAALANLSPNAAVLGVGGELPIDEDFLANQLSSSLNDKNVLTTKQVNAQLFNQFMNQALTKSQPVVDNTVLAGAAPGVIVNQSLSANYSEAVLPAITVSPQNSQWNAQVGDRISWMVNNNMQRAEIRLDPPELGKLDIQLNISKDNQASILIHVTNATAKEAIESALPRLREMFEQQGLDLANVDVSQQNTQQQQSAFEQFENEDNTNNSQNNSYGGDLNGESSEDDILAVTNLQANYSTNLLDLFA